MVVKDVTQTLRDHHIFQPHYAYIVLWATTQTSVTAKKVSEALNVSERCAEQMLERLEGAGLIETGEKTKRKKRLMIAEVEKPDQTQSLPLRFAYYIWEQLKPLNIKTIDKAFMDTWTEETKSLLKDRNVKDVMAVFEWAINDNFWRKNILSPNGLNKNYDKVLMAMRADDKEEKKPQVVITKKYLTDEEDYGS